MLSLACRILGLRISKYSTACSTHTLKCACMLAFSVNQSLLGILTFALPHTYLILIGLLDLSYAGCEVTSQVCTLCVTLSRNFATADRMTATFFCARDSSSVC